MSQFGGLFNIRKFAADQRANVAMIFALSALVLVGLTGMGVDYYKALSTKSQLDLAADAASIEAITTVSSYIKANPTTDVTTAFNTIKPTAISQGQNAFIVNAGKAYTRTMTTAPTPDVTLGSDKQTVSASINYTAASPNAFGPLFSVKKINMSGTSSASLTLPKYLDFYMLLDMSGSMGFPSTSTGQTQLTGLNHDNNDVIKTGRAFACHFPGNACSTKTKNGGSASAPCTGYNLAATNVIQLRAAAVGEAIKDLITNAKLTMQNTGLTKQFRLGIYPYIKTMDVFYALSTDLDGASTAISNLGGGNGQGLSNLLDTGVPTQGQTCTTNKGVKTCTPGYGSGGTDTNVALNGLTVNNTHTVNGIIDEIQVTGNGSSSTSPQAFVFLVTDGAQNPQSYNNGFQGSNVPYNLDPNWCTAVKKNAYIAVLYIPYEPINPPSTAYNNEDNNVNAIIPNIPNTLQQCASNGFYFTATTPDQINSTMVQMFYQAVDQVAHLTH